MSFTSETYNSILQDILERKVPLTGIASRMMTLNNGINFVYAINIESRLREAFISVDERPERVSFPKWHGVSIDLVLLPTYNSDQYYIRLIQLPQSENYIFDIIIEDLHKTAESIDDHKKCFSYVFQVLLKWKKFFQSEKDLILSDEMQEGLYGELFFLERCIQNKGVSAIHSWAGGNRETHDFYFASSAVEVKASSKKEPYSAQISSEYQLDPCDIPGRLFLFFLAVRKSKSSGDRLPMIIERIRKMLRFDGVIKNQFDDKIKQYGYLDELSEMYITGFDIRDSYYFEVTGDFPRITRNMYRPGISKVVYELQISLCMPYSCEESFVFSTLEGRSIDVKQ